MTLIEIKLSKSFEKGIHFSCQMCGTCCRGFNEGEVYLYRDDIIRLANFLGYKGNNGFREFAKKFLKVVKNTFYWKEPKATRGKNYKVNTLGFKFTGEDEHCHFLKDNKCNVHSARPFQCRCFPFWQMMVSNKNNFIDYSKKCPGLRTLKGTYYSREKVLDWARKEYLIEKNHFLEMKNNNFDILKVYLFLTEDMVNK
ncbi:MAG: YkgJ family cysteine cluster protein [Candidatus Hodarchaeota archaeon]